MFDRDKIVSAATAHHENGVSAKWRNIFAALAIIGAAAFLFRLTGDTSQRTWQVFLVNFLYFTGIAQGMLVVTCVLQITSARWARPLKRFAEFGALFLPFSLVFLVILYFGRNDLFDWIAHPVEEKAAWLNINFLFVRDFIGFVLMAGLSYFYFKTSVRWDAEAADASAEVNDKHQKRLGLFATAIVLCFAIIYTLVAFDLIMSLDPHWYSTLFGAYFFITCFLAGLASLVVILVISRKHMGLEEYITPKHFHDLGKLMFGFLVLSGDFFWSQFIVIWYGNLPEETGFVLMRIREMPWAIITRVVFLGAFAIPFVMLLSQSLKKKPALIMSVSLLILSCLWFERFLLIVPSVWREQSLPLGIFEVLISLGFLGLFGLVYMLALKRHAAIRFNDPMLQEYLRGEAGH